MRSQAQLNQHAAFLVPANAARSAEAAKRDVAIARTLLARDPMRYDASIVSVRATFPYWTWAQIGRHLGLTKWQAVSQFRRLAIKNGLR